MSRYSASRGMLYTAPPGPEGEDDEEHVPGDAPAEATDADESVAETAADD